MAEIKKVEKKSINACLQSVHPKSIHHADEQKPPQGFSSDAGRRVDEADDQLSRVLQETGPRELGESRRNSYLANRYQFAPNDRLHGHPEALIERISGAQVKVEDRHFQENHHYAQKGAAPNVLVLSAPVRGHPGIALQNASAHAQSTSQAPEWLPSFPVASFVTLPADQKMSAIASSPVIKSHQQPTVSAFVPPSPDILPPSSDQESGSIAEPRRRGGNNLHLVAARYATMVRLREEESQRLPMTNQVAENGMLSAPSRYSPQQHLVEGLQQISISTTHRPHHHHHSPAAFGLSRPSTTRLGELPVRSDEEAFAPYTFLAVLGKGNFGKVILSRDRRRHDHRLCAIKVLKKHDMFKKREVVHTMTEAAVLKTLRHPFLVECYSAFQTATRLCLVLEFVVGGELYYHLFKERRFSEARTKFYVAEIVLAVGFLHANDYIYRDLKLENLLLDAAGHIKIADFGLCKDLKAWKNEQLFGSVDEAGYEASTSTGSTNRRRMPPKRDMTFCGTPEYLAPEMLHVPGSFNLISRGAHGGAGASGGLLIYGKGVDWWALGIIIFEMLLGQLPFRTKTGDYDHLFHSIRHRDIVLPDSLDGDVRILLTGLLQKNPPQRLGHSHGNGRDYLDICESAWFHDVDWDAVYRKQIPAPFVPTIHDAEDTRHFSREFLEMPTELTPTTSFTLGYGGPHARDNHNYDHHRFYATERGGGGGGGQLADDLFRGFSFTRNF